LGSRRKATTDRIRFCVGGGYIIIANTNKILGVLRPALQVKVRVLFAVHPGMEDPPAIAA